MALLRSRAAVMTTAAAMMMAVTLMVASAACSSPAKLGPAAPSAPPSRQPAAPATAPRLTFSFDDEPLGSTAGFHLDDGATTAQLEVQERGGHGRVLALSASKAQDAPPAVSRAGLVLPADAVAALRGRRVTVSASVKGEGGYPYASMIGLDLERSDGSKLRLRSPKTSGPEWQPLQLAVDIPADARNLGVWFSQTDAGEVRLDDLRFAVVGAAGEGDLPPRPITPRGLSNLMALARLYGAIRYFHPSVEAAQADWDRLLIEAIEPVEQARDARELAERLTAVFQPVAPSATIAAGERAPHNRIEAAAPQPGATPLRWLHQGVQLSSSLTPIYRSARVSSLMAKRDHLVQLVDVRAMAGQTLELSAFLRITGTPGVLVVAGVPGGAEEPAYTMVEAPARWTQWRQAKLQVKVPDGARHLFVMVELEGPGKLMLDDVSLRAVTGASPRELLRNGDFEEPGGSIYPADWGTALEADGYERRAESKGCPRGKGCASLTARPQPELEPGEAVAMQLPGGVAAEIPLVVWGSPSPSPEAPAGAITWPKGTGERVPAQPHYAMPTDRSTRLASVMQLWNVLQHFYPNFDVVHVDWMAQLAPALAAAATDEDDAQLTETLEHLTKELRDGHVRVAYPRAHRGELPIKLQLVEGRWMITGVAPAASGVAAAGDELLAIDDRPVGELAAALRPRISAATAQYEDVLVEQRLLIGPLDRSATLKLRAPAGVERISTLRYALVGTVREAARPAPLAELEPGLWYVDVGEVSKQQLEQALPALARARAVILDLRGYTNQATIFEHLVDKPVATPWWLMPITTRPDREGTTFSKTNAPLVATAPRLQGKLVVLADGRSVSAMETFLSIIKHHKLATIVGATSAGTNGDVNPIALPSGHVVSWSGLRVQSPSGQPHHGAGVAPDVKVTPTLAAVRAKRDEVLERGLELGRGTKPAAPAKP